MRIKWQSDVHCPPHPSTVDMLGAITISIRLLTFLLILEVESLQFLNIQFFVTCKRNVL